MSRGNFVGAVALLIVLALLSLGLGRSGLATPADWLTLWQRDPALANEILVSLRLPRLILAVLIGGSLALAGAAMQGLLRNPLADPGILGTSSGAAFGAVIAFYFGAVAVTPLALPLGGLIGAGTAVTLLFLLMGRDASGLTLILAGVAVSSLFGALTALALNLAPSPYAATEIVFWMLGSLTDRSFDHVWLAAPPILIGSALLLRTGRALDALTLGEETAASLGFDLARLRKRIVIGTALIVGGAVAVSGVIGFVGFVAPHVLRPLVKHRPGALLPASALGGAVLLTAADLAVRFTPPGPEIKLGVMTALVGAPFFLWLLMRLRREAA
jgi:iron complex transport system permease protein